MNLATMQSPELPLSQLNPQGSLDPQQVRLLIACHALPAVATCWSMRDVDLINPDERKLAQAAVAVADQVLLALQQPADPTACYADDEESL